MVAIGSTLEVPSPPAVRMEALPHEAKLGMVLSLSKPLTVAVEVQVQRETTDVEGVDGPRAVTRVYSRLLWCSPSLTERNVIAALDRFEDELSGKVREHGLPLP